MICYKKLEEKKFQKKIFKGGDPLMSKRLKNIFSIFQIFKFSKSIWKMASIGSKKCWKKQSHEIWAQSEPPLSRYMRFPSRGGSLDPLLCWIGLSGFWFSKNQFKCSLHLGSLELGLLKFAHYTETEFGKNHIRNMTW